MVENKKPTEKPISDIASLLEEKKQLDLARKRKNNTRQAFSEKVGGFFQEKRAADFSFLAPQGCIVLQAPPEQAEDLVLKGIAEYLEIDPKNKIANVKVDSQNRAVYTYKCTKLKGHDGRLNVEEYVLIYMPQEQYEWFQTEQAKMLNSHLIEDQKAKVESAIDALDGN